MKIEPFEDRIVVQSDEPEKLTPSGLYIPENAKEKPTRGTCLAVGPGHRKEDGEFVPLDIKVGDTVLYSKFAGTEVTEDGEDLLIISSRDVLARIRG